jgi:3D (Asp-Asp-Asp) domain-containing protein
MIDGIVYTVEDRGSGVNGNKVDIYFATHEEALKYGTKSREVYAVAE